MILLSVVLIGSLLSSCSFVEELMKSAETAAELPKGIVEDAPLGYTEIDRLSFEGSAYYTPYRCDISYHTLTDDEQALYDGLLEKAYRVYPEADDSGFYHCEQVLCEDMTLSALEIRTALKAVYDDHPELYWISSSFKHLSDKSRNYTAVQMFSVISPDRIISETAALREAVDSFLLSVDEGMSEYEREKSVHDYLIDSCDYSSQAASADSALGLEEYYSVYGALVRGEAVCEGYARAFQLISNLLGLKTVGITGMSKGRSDSEEELHMWNAVSLDGDWVLTDVTWDDQEELFQRYDYFNLPESEMNKDHTPSKLLSELSEDEIEDDSFTAVSLNLFVPPCEEDGWQYYVRECPILSDFDGREVIDALFGAAERGEEQLQFYVDPESLDVTYAAEALFKDPQYFFDYIRDVNDRLEYTMIDTTSVGFYCNDKRSYIVVQFHYL